MARKITAGANNPYDKARAVERYLQTDGGFRYETRDVPVPKENEDFVDQFLFDTKRGIATTFPPPWWSCSAPPMFRRGG